MSINAIKAIYDSVRGLSPVQHAVLVNLAFHLNDKTGKCFPKQDTIVEETNCSKRAVRDALGELKDKGLIERRTREGKRNHEYVLKLPESAPPKSVNPAAEDSTKAANPAAKNSAEAANPAAKNSAEAANPAAEGGKSNRLKRQMPPLEAANPASYSSNENKNEKEVVDRAGDTPAPPSAAAAVFNSKISSSTVGNAMPQTANATSAPVGKTTFGLTIAKIADDLSGMTADGKHIDLHYDVERAIDVLAKNVTDDGRPNPIPSSFIAERAEDLKEHGGYPKGNKMYGFVSPDGFTAHCRKWWKGEKNKDHYRNTPYDPHPDRPKFSPGTQTVNIGKEIYSLARVIRSYAKCQKACANGNRDLPPDQDVANPWKHCNLRKMPPGLTGEDAKWEYEPCTCEKFRPFAVTPPA